MGNCTWFGSGSRDWSYRESVAVLSGGELGQRKESCNVGVPIEQKRRIGNEY